MSSNLKPQIALEDAPEDIRLAVRQLSFAYQRGAQVQAQHMVENTTSEGPIGTTPAPSLADAVRRAEAILFAAGAPVSAAELAEAMPPGVDVADVLMALKAGYSGRGVSLIEVDGRWRFQTAEDLSYLFVEERHEQKRLSQAALETLAIIAYGQPVTRAEIEAVRGVAVSRTTIDTLMETGWVKYKGRRKTPGRPLTLGTTDKFLEHFGLESLEVLPGRADLEAEGLLSDVIPAGMFVDGTEMHHEADPDAEEESVDSDLQADDATGFVTDFMSGEAADEAD